MKLNPNLPPGSEIRLTRKVGHKKISSLWRVPAKILASKSTREVVVPSKQYDR